MKNAKRMTSLVGHYLSNRTIAAVLFSIVALAEAIPSQAQRTTFTMPRYTPPAQTYHPPAPRPAPKSTYHPPAQTQPRPAPAQATPQRTTGSTPQPRREATPSRPAAPSRKEVQKQEKAQVRTQKEQQKQNQKQQKEQARAKKEQQKQNQNKQKEQARQQKEVEKKQKSENKVAKSAKAPKAGAASPAVAKAPASKVGPKSTAGTSASRSETAESQTQVQRLNSSRSNMSGINRRPLPAGEMTVHSNGRMTLKAEGGRQYGLRSNGTIASYSDREKTVSFDKGGKVSSIHTASMDVHNGAHGQRTIISRRADGSKVVSTGRHSGYVERSVVMNNRTYVQRTTVINGRGYTRTFVANGFGRVALVPPAFFAPGFYGWAYYPWAAPISFTWGWAGAPWYVGAGYIGPSPYFVASPRYPGAAFWLTDYMIGQTLATAYQLRHDADGFDDASDDMADDTTTADATDGNSDEETLRADSTTPITPELKAEIAEEVKQELTNDNAEASNPSQASFDMLPAALSTPNHVFVVSSDLDVTTTDQQLCALQAGDMLQLMTPAGSDAGLVELRVASSKRTDCPAGVLVSVSVTDLQEMQNNFQAQIEAGLGTLRDNQGRDGLPSAPPDAVAAPPRAATGLAPFSAADSQVALDQQREQADQTEKQAASGAF